jgi:hypothetical protein
MIDRLTACWSVSQGAEALVAGASIVTSFMGARSFFDTNVLVILREIRAVQNVAGARAGSVFSKLDSGGYPCP